LAVTFYIFALLVPLAQLLVAFAAWLVPLHFKAQQRMCIAGEVVGCGARVSTDRLTLDDAVKMHDAAGVESRPYV
jgi:hypothetical protein